MPSRSRCNSFRKRTAFRPEHENVLCRVHVAVVDRSAISTFPSSYSAACDTFRASDASAFGTGAGSPCFGNDFAHTAKRNRFVRQHVLEHRPACVMHGLRHASLSKLRRAHVSDVNSGVLTRDARRNAVKIVAPLACDFGRYSPCSGFLTALLVKGELGFGVPVEGWHFDSFASGQRGEGFQAKVDSYCPASTPLGFRDLHGDVGVPAAPCVHGQGPGTEIRAGRQRARQPQGISLAAEPQSVSVQFCALGKRSNRNPVQVAPVRPEAWRSRKRRAPRHVKASADLMQCIGMHSEFGCRAFHQVGQREGSWAPHVAPGSPTVMRPPVNFATVVPDEIHRSRLIAERAPTRCSSVFQTIAVGQNHNAESMQSSVVSQ